MVHKNNKKTVVQAGLLSAFRLMGVQSLIVILISLVWGWHNFNTMMSVLLGGFVSIVPNVFFARRFFASGRATDPQKIVRAFYKGELLKWVMTIGLAILIFTQWSVLVLPFLTGLVSASLGLWFAPFILVSKTKAATI